MQKTGVLPAILALLFSGFLFTSNAISHPIVAFVADSPSPMPLRAEEKTDRSDTRTVKTTNLVTRKRVQLRDGIVNDIAPATATSGTDSKHQEKVQTGKDAARRVTGEASLSSSINGQQKIEYLIDGKTGQSLELEVRSSNERIGYNLSAPAAPRALYRGHGVHSTHRVTLPRDGTYRLLLFLTEPAANNGERADFALKIRLRNPG